jgi:hypothetical protein
MISMPIKKNQLFANSRASETGEKCSFKAAVRSFKAAAERKRDSAQLKP